MDSLWRDLRFSLRQLAAHKVFTAAAVLSLALGIGVNTAVFSFVNALFLRPLPVEQPERLVAIFVTDPNTPGLLPLSYLNSEDLPGLVGDAFSGFASHRAVTASLATGETPEQVEAELVSGRYFELLAVPMAAGRGFGPETDAAPGAHPVAVLSHDLWRRRFGSDPAVVGTTVRVNRRPFTVVGVADARFRGVNLLSPPDLWLPMGMYDQVASGVLRQFFDLRRGLMLSALARLAPGVGETAAGETLAAAAAELERRFPEDNAGRGLELVPLAETRINPNRRATFTLAGKALLTVTGLVLLIACANVANLLLARAAGRRKEFAVRLALGAGRRRIVQQLLLEGLVLALAGGVVGLGVGVVTRSLLWSYRVAMLPAGLDVGLDPRVLLFTLGASLATGVLFAVAPALQSARTDLVTHLKEGAAQATAGGRRWRASEALIVLQVAFSLVTLVGTGLFLRSLDGILERDPGFETRRVAMVSFDLGAEGYDRPRAETFYRRAVERVEALPGVESVTIAETALLSGGGVQRRLLVDGRGQEDSDATLVRAISVGDGYFRTAGIPLAAGRPVEERDRTDAPLVAVLNSTLAARLFADEPAVGKRLRFVGEGELIEVVGVAGDVKFASPAEDPPVPIVYLPLDQRFSTAGAILVRTAGDPKPLLPRLRRELQQLDPEVPLVGLTGVAEHLRSIPSGLRMAIVFLGTFAVLALLLSALGIFGVMEYSVSRRGRELVVRFALGAQRRDVVAMILRQTMTVVAVGLVVGLVCAALFAGWIERFLVASSPFDMPTFAAAVALFAAVGVAASLLPARRAAATDPAGLLRTR